MRLNRMREARVYDRSSGLIRRVYAPKLAAPIRQTSHHAPSSTPVRIGFVPVTRPSGAPAVTKRIARRI